MAPELSQKTIPFEDFKKQLEMAVTTVTKMIEEQLNASEAPIAFNTDSLIRHIQQRIPQDGLIVKPTRVNVSAGLGPYFSKLPRELRIQIFSDLLVSGNPAFMRTSRAMEQEAKGLIAKEGIYRLNFGFIKKPNCQKPTQQVLATIKYVAIKVNDSGFTPALQSYSELHPELELLEPFAGPTPHRKTCSMSSDYKGDDYPVFIIDVMSRISLFSGFEKVVLRYSINQSPNLGDCAWVRVLESMELSLGKSLGKAQTKLEKDGWSTTFYPRKAENPAPIISSGNDSSG